MNIRSTITKTAGSASRLRALAAMLFWMTLVVTPPSSVTGTAVQYNATVRGQIQRFVNNHYYTAQYVPVSIAYRASPNNRYTQYTGVDGMFYFHVGYGDYVLQVWDAAGRAVSTLYLRVDRPRVDVPPITIR